MTPRRSGYAAVAALLALFALFILKGALIAPPAPDPARTGFDHERALSRLRVVLGDEKPHPVDSAENDAVRARIVRLLTDMGYAPIIGDDFSCRLAVRWRSVACARVRNIVAMAGPAEGPVTLVAAHYDSVAAGPGASDDGAGVAVLLEIAAIMKEKPPARPVAFLISDGEETSLLGAASFMREDPLAARVASVVNLEARGVRGPSTMFETSAPNGRDVAAFAAVGGGRGNSLATDIYRMMPNDTDASEFRNKGADIHNYAFTDGVAFYHTPRDTMAALSEASFAHQGASALASLNAFLSAKPDGAEGARAFADLLGLGVLSAPLAAGVVAIILALGASMVVFWRAGGAGALGAIAAPFAAMIGAGALAFGAQALIASMRPEAQYFAAAPGALRGVYAASALFAAFLAHALLGVAAHANRRIAAAWATLFALGAAACVAAPGAAGLFAPPAALFLIAAAVSRIYPRALKLGALAAFALAAALLLPSLHLAEINLGLDRAAPVAIFLSLLASIALSLLAGAPRRIVAAAPAILFAASLALAIAAPAYDANAPQGVNVEHIVDVEAGESAAILQTEGAPPAAMLAAAPFGPMRIAGGSERQGARLPAHDLQPVGVAMRSEPLADGRRLSLRLQANGADEIILRAPAEAKIRLLTIGDQRFELAGDGGAMVRCVGRACGIFEVVAEAAAAPAQWRVIGRRYGLGPEAEAIARARPETAVPVHTGDVRIIAATRRL